MTTRESLLRYFHIINKLRKSQATFKEIDEYLAKQSELQGYHFNVSKRQFQRDLEDIGAIFEIEINYDFRRRVYAIDDELHSEISQRRLEAFDTFNALKIGENTSKSILFEKRRPQGTEYLFGLLHAIKSNLQIRFTYHKFWDDAASERVLEPLALREFKNRWYILGFEIQQTKGKKAIKTFALDRILELEITKAKFLKPTDFDLTEQFRHCFGIISPLDESPQEVILSFDPFQGKYIKTMPLHESQEIVIDNEKELRVKLSIYTTYDFKMELLSYGKNLRVIKPDSLVQEMKESLEKTLAKYEPVSE
jgi:predicted DNA-binding transcriptional regulator YafY